VGSGGGLDGHYQKVNNRQTLSNALIAADLTAFGVGVSAARQDPVILVALAVLSSLLWLFWLVQTLQIYRIAAYVALELRLRLVELCGCSVLDWEAYVRRLTFSRQTAAMAIYKNRDPKAVPNISRNIDGVYISLLLGGATPLILAGTAIAAFHHNAKALSWKIEVGASLVLWLYAILKAISVMRTTRSMSRKIIEEQDQH
jgi:hypothetical protein